MPAAAPIVSRRLAAVVAREARPGVVFAEVWRDVGAEADRLGLARPSYEQVRVLTHDAIARRLRRTPVGEALVLAAFDPLVKRGLGTLAEAVAAAVEEHEYRSKRPK